jgi:hypothetical protein
MTIILLLILVSLVLWALVGTIVVAGRDGFHRLPARSMHRRTPVSID